MRRILAWLWYNHPVSQIGVLEFLRIKLRNGILSTLEIAILAAVIVGLICIIASLLGDNIHWKATLLIVGFWVIAGGMLNGFATYPELVLGKHLCILGWLQNTWQARMKDFEERNSTYNSG